MSYKLGHLSGDQWIEHSYPPQFKLVSGAGRERLMLGVPGGDSTVLERLLSCLSPPYFFLYVLHTPRGEADPGRYQSPSLEHDALVQFLKRFSDLLSKDARHDSWIHSPNANATLVWDRHNLIHAYGPLDCFETALRALGFAEGTVDIPDPHQHNYRVEFDEDAKALMEALDWHRTPLQPQDEQ